MKVAHHKFCSSTNCCFTGKDPHHLSAYMSKQNNIPEHADMHTAKCAYEDLEAWGV